MNSEMLARFSLDALRWIAEPALRGMIIAGAVAGLLWIFRVRGASAKIVAWTVVLCSALTLPAVTWLLPPLPGPVSCPAATSLPASNATNLSVTGARQYRNCKTRYLTCRRSERIPLRFKVLESHGDWDPEHCKTQPYSLACFCTCGLPVHFGRPGGTTLCRLYAHVAYASSRCCRRRYKSAEIGGEVHAPDAIRPETPPS